MFLVRDIMTQHPHTLKSTDTIAAANALMIQYDIRHIPIVDNDSYLLGIITERDILLARQASSHDIHPKPDIDRAPIDDFMHKNISTISSRAGLKEAAFYMQKHRIGCLPVLHDQKLIGIITNSDFVSIAINLMELQDETDPVDFDDLNDNDDMDSVLDELDDLNSLDLDNISHEKDELL